MARRHRPHFRIHVSIASHPKTAAIWANLELRGCYVEIGRRAIEQYAGKTGDAFLCSTRELMEITGTEQGAAAVKRMHRLLRVSTEAARVSYEAGTSTNPEPCVIFDVFSCGRRDSPTVARLWRDCGATVARLSRDGRNFYRVGLRNFLKKQGMAPRTVVPPKSEVRSPKSDNPKGGLVTPQAANEAAVSGRRRSPPEGAYWIAGHLRARIAAAFPEARIPDTTEDRLRPWAVVIDRMLRIDGREASKVVAAIDWALGANLKREAPFVVLSAGALRSKYDRMSIAVRRDIEGGAGGRAGAGTKGDTVANAAARVRTRLREPGPG